MFVFMNAVYTSDIQRIEVRSQQKLWKYIIWKILWGNKNMSMKTLDILLWMKNKSKGVQRIWNRVLYILKKLQVLLLIVIV